MHPPRRLIPVLLIGVFLTKTTVWAQETGTTELSRERDGPVVSATSSWESNFIDFDESVDDSDIFRYGRLEYLMLTDVRRSQLAYETCKQQNAVLAYIESVDLANFLAVALSETRFDIDTLWVAGKRDPNNTTRWVWHKEGQDVPLSDEVAGLIVSKADLAVEAKDRNCLGFGRLDHDRPQLRPLTCMGKRAIICQRTRGGGGKGNSTHPGWIKIRERLYKIFASKVTYETAEVTCPMYDNDASLAVVVSSEDAQVLGRYLLIGRPSLENAWMGARWSGNSYKFETESITLSNATDAETAYPPWRINRITKANGCLLLDRHLRNTTLFVEARCERERAVICYKMDKSTTDGTNSSDVIFEPFGYRLISNPLLSWDKARVFCHDKYRDYGAKLVELDDANQTRNMLYVMGENKTAVQHVWVGGHFDDSRWVWVSKNQTIDESMLNWVKNQSYEEIVEHNNICLNMDRENHIRALHYGAQCGFAQPFVCQFSAVELRKLQLAEHGIRPRASAE